MIARYTVLIDRDIADEEERGNFGASCPTDTEFVKQLREELQLAFDEGNILTGSFQIVRREIL